MGICYKIGHVRDSHSGTKTCSVVCIQKTKKILGLCNENQDLLSAWSHTTSMYLTYGIKTFGNSYYILFFEVLESYYGFILTI